MGVFFLKHLHLYIIFHYICRNEITHTMTTEEILLITNGLSAIAGLWFWRRSDTYKKEVKEASDAHDNLLSVFTKAGNDFESFRTESAAIINQSAENNAKLVLEIESLKSDRQKLFDIAKGATDKLAEMNVALEGLEVKDEKDWSKEPFPRAYEIPKGTICVSLVDMKWNEFKTKANTKFKSLQDSYAPYLERIGVKHRAESYNQFFDAHIDACIYSEKLAPLNPLDHPNHPNFRG